MVSADALHTELWTSWASVLRSYAAAHGLQASQHAVVEVSHRSITLRVGPRWLHFTPHTVEGSQHLPQSFSIAEDGTIRLNDQPPEEMDLAAERFTRELLLNI